jgi:ribokinase
VKVVDEASAIVASAVLHDKGIYQVLITLGSAGVWFSERGQGQMFKGFNVKAVDTTAAGDCFNGALMAPILKGKSMTDALIFAQASAALSVTRLGAQGSIPELNEVLAFIKSQRKRQ